MDFFEHQDVARGKTVRLVALYALVVAVLSAITYFLALAVVGSIPAGARYLGNRAWDPWLCVWTTSFTLAVILIGVIYKTAQLSGGGPAVARMLGGRHIVPDNCRAGERVLLNVVEEMAIASTTPVPPVFVLDYEEGINAFAAGYGPRDAVIAVSRGAVQYLSRDELQGVIAHEFSHLLNGDMRLNLRLIGVLHGILLIAYLGDAALRAVAESGRQTRKVADSDIGREVLNMVPVDAGQGIVIAGWYLLLTVLGVGLQMIGFVGAFFGSLIKSGVSKQREYLADAAAVQFTRNPEGVAGALKKIGGLERGSRVRARRAAQASHLFFSSGVDASMINLFPTHPPLRERIRRIDPHWDGKYPDTVAPVGGPRVELQTAAYAKGERRGLSPPKAQRHPAPGTPPQTLQTAALLGGIQPAAPTRPEELASDGPPPDADPPPDPLAELPDLLRSAVEDPLAAQAVVLLFLLSDDAAQREKQLPALGEPPPAGLTEQITALAPAVAGLADAARLPLVELAAPALRRLTADEARAFRDRVQRLIDADSKVSFFEFALLCSLRRHLAGPFGGEQPPGVRYTELPPVLPACSQLLSVLAHLGSADEKGAYQAFTRAAEVLSPAGGLRLHDRYYVSVRRADIALEELAQAEPAIKRQVLAACVACVAHDGKVTAGEAELLRAVADSLDCPVPGIVVARKELEG